MTVEKNASDWIDELLRGDISREDAVRLSGWLEENRQHRDQLRTHVLMNHLLSLHFKTIDEENRQEEIQSSMEETQIPLASMDDVLHWEHTVKPLREVVLPVEPVLPEEKPRLKRWSDWFFRQTTREVPVEIPSTTSNVGFLIRLTIFILGITFLCVWETTKRAKGNRSRSEYENWDNQE